MKVGIVGMGVVGAAQAALFQLHQQVTYDIRDVGDYPEAMAACDFVIICVGTPSDDTGSADLGGLENALASLAPEQPVLIRSTVPPGTTERIAASRPGHVAHAPEFIHERDGGEWKRSLQVPFMLLGGGGEARKFFRPYLEKVFPSPIHECSAMVAELAKYTSNLYWAMRVTYVNEMANIAATFGADWAEVRDAWLEDPRVHPAYTAMTGFLPGFGGRCWPKDLEALIMAANEAGYQAWFLDAIMQQNEMFTK